MTVVTNRVKELQSFITEKIGEIEFPNKPSELYEPISYILSLGGKRMRPVLTLMGCELMGGKPEDALHQAVAIEIFHNFTLVHDDIMDNAPLRRNSPTVHEKWNENIAILSGDVMLVYAYQLLMKCDPDLLPLVLTEFNKTAIEVCEGQQFDMNFETTETVTREEYRHMIGLKTAVLLGASLKIGAIVGGGSSKDCSLLYDFGKHMGLAFQMQDDVLDVYGDPERFGKQVGGDIIANKKTWMLIEALERAEGESKEELNYWLNKEEFDHSEKVSKVTAIYDRLGVKDIVKAEMLKHHRTALDCLERIEVGDAQKLTLRTFSEQLLVRDI